eukprot:CAMPEP_0195292528 /NCGR_PEP_ID=MMETSP0707-20130614/9936_1 /TAXON_ID=33640 /ORGANISM="Asterionellopsis glacialis, Strain CCMP134" /LENGTH=283 /DNA_ID=CAMNT_0040353013 /DNA_START=122 /DNA_END=970 /DNA_ORIENTATION=-
MSRSATNSPVTLTVLAFSGVCTLAVFKYLKGQYRSSTEIEDEDAHQLQSGCSPQDVLQLIQKRRSIFPKQYTGNPLPRQMIQQLLEAARWAPSHHLTEPWHFVVFESDDAKTKLGSFLAQRYKVESQAKDKFSQAKYDKKLKNAQKASHVVSIGVRLNGKCPVVEEICSVSMAVQNMLLVAAAYDIGAYWSSSGVYDPTVEKTKVLSSSSKMIVNPPELDEFLNYPSGASAGDETTASSIEYLCLGWMFVGEFYDPNETNASKRKKWPTSRRKSLEEDNRVEW